MDMDLMVTPERTVLLGGMDKRAALETLAARIAADMGEAESARVLAAVLEREEALSTRIAPGIAIPHATLGSDGATRIALGISAAGVVYDTPEAPPVHVIVMVVGSEGEHLKAMSQVAQRLQRTGLCERLLACRDAAEACAMFLHGAGGPAQALAGESQRMYICARQLAVDVGARTLLVHCPSSDMNLPRAEAFQVRQIRVVCDTEAPPGATDILNMPFRGLAWRSLLELSLLLALSRGVVDRADRVVSVFGSVDPKRLDTIVLSDMNREFKSFRSMSEAYSLQNLDQAVFIRALQLATELASEGREGKPVGTLFVLGDHAAVSAHCSQLVINPFAGYEESKRNILDPSLGETLKEFSRIDGAIVIRGDGVVMSAGTYLRVDHSLTNFPPGLGARHAAAAGISAVSGALAIAVSESTGKISVFRAGERAMEI